MSSALFVLVANNRSGPMNPVATVIGVVVFLAVVIGGVLSARRQK